MKMNSKKSTGEITINIILYILVILIGGFTNMYLWNNIIAELFDIRTLNFVQAIAVDLVVGYFIYQHKEDDRAFTDKLSEALSTTLSSLLIGFILTFFI